jgi:hypothetical protein
MTIETNNDVDLVSDLDGSEQAGGEGTESQGQVQDDVRSLLEAAAGLTLDENTGRYRDEHGKFASPDGKQPTEGQQQQPTEGQQQQPTEGQQQPVQAPQV